MTGASSQPGHGSTFTLPLFSWSECTAKPGVYSVAAQSETASSPGTMGRVRGRRPRRAMLPT
jgi:hypothetical protein